MRNPGGRDRPRRTDTPFPDEAEGEPDPDLKEEPDYDQNPEEDYPTKVEDGLAEDAATNFEEEPVRRNRVRL